MVYEYSFWNRSIPKIAVWDLMYTQFIPKVNGIYFHRYSRLCSIFGWRNHYGTNKSGAPTTWYWTFQKIGREWFKIQKLMPAPRNIRELKVFIGKINYYKKLFELRRKEVNFLWRPNQEEAFDTLKTATIELIQLDHYNDQLNIVFTTDVSQNGIRAVIWHKYLDGTEKPIPFASKTLNSSQVCYSQIVKESLSIIVGVTKIHQYICGRTFELLMDNL